MIRTPPQLPLSRLSLLKEFLTIFIPFTLLLGVIATMHYYNSQETERVTRENSETLNVELAKSMISSDLSAVMTDLMFLAEHLQSQEIIYHNLTEKQRRIAQEFSVFAKNKHLYDQIRFLDHNGMEIVRVNYNGGNPRVVPTNELQDKSRRYYFRDALDVGIKEVYVSPLDLNVEEQRIEFPYKPMMRFGTPVYDKGGQKHGLVFLNYFGIRLIRNFVQAAANISDHVSLINNAGYWLRSPNSEDEWGFMLGKDNTFPGRFPAVSTEIWEQDSGQIYAEQGLFTFTTVYPMRIAQAAVNPLINKLLPPEDIKSSTYFWKIISRITPQELAATPFLFVNRHLSLYAAMLGIMIIGSLLLAKARLRHHLAEAQTEYEQLFRYTLENIALAAVSVDRTGTVTFCNDYFLELTGWGHDDVVGSNWLERFTPAEQRDSARELLKLMQTPDTFPSTWETEVQSRDKSRHLMFWTNNLSFNANGDVIGVTSIGEDITDARKTEEELRKLSGAVEQSPSIVLITNRDGMIEYVNPKFTEITGYASAEVIGSSPSFLKSGDTSPNEYRKLWEIISAGKEWRGEFHNRKKNGELYWESAAISAIRNQDGEITNYLAVKEDITERKRLEREVEERNRELAKTQTLAVMGRMASMIAHDLRNPLSSVKMSMQILGKQADQQQDKKALELRQIALEQIRYMEEILSDMLTYSRPDALKTEWLSIDKLLDMATGLAQKRIAEYGVKVTTHYQPGLPTFPGDANKLRQVFSNLIVNAAQATEGMDDQAPLMSIETMLQLGTSGTSIQVKISDNGAGFDPEEQDKLFEPFFTTRAKGTGLGLAIVKRIIDQHHGTVELRSRGSRGTNAMVTLPTRTDADTEKTVGGIQ